MTKYIFLGIIGLFLTSCGSQKSTKNKNTANHDGNAINKPSFLSEKPQNVEIYTSEKGEGLGPCEPSIFINPANPKQVVAGSIINFAHYSDDGGASWKTNQLKSTLGVWGDPVITADKKGNFYYLHLSDPEGTNWRSDMILDRIVIQKSSDGGLNWSDGTGIGHNPPKQQDKEWATVNPKNNEIYVTWTEFDAYDSPFVKDKTRIQFSKSTDEGATWETPVAINQFDGNCLDDDDTVEGAVPASDGENIYVAWSYNNKIWFDKSNDNGKSWLANDIIIGQQENGWKFKIPGVNRTNGMPITAVDQSDSPHKGTVYVNWSAQLNDLDTDIFLAKSTDQGTTWSAPIRVNTDTTKTHQFMTWMSVDPKTGYIYIVYYDRSHQTGNLTDVSLAISKDGGTTFDSSVISTSPFDPTDCSFFGDYNNISAQGGQIRPIWTRYADKKLSVWTALIEN